MLRFFARRLLCAESAVDLLAETWAQAVLDRGKFRGRNDEQAIAWVYGIARHRLQDHLRTGVIERKALARLDLPAPAINDEEIERIEEVAGIAELCRSVREAFDKLPVEHREALHLRVIDERGYDEIATELQISTENARARVSRALRTLRTQLGDEPAEVMA